MAAVGEALGRALPPQTPPPGLRERVLTRATAPAVEDARFQKQVAPRRSLSYGWLAAAAALVAAVTSVMAWQYRDEAARARIEQQQTALRVRSLEQQMASLQSAVATAAQTRSVLAARDMARVDLSGQVPAPGAAGRVFWSPTYGLVFAATNLPALPPGRVYQLWVVADTPISAGIGQPTSAGELSVVSTPAAPRAAEGICGDHRTRGRQSGAHHPDFPARLVLSSGGSLFDATASRPADLRA